MSKIGEYNSLYGFIDNNQSMVICASTAIVGSTTFGPYGVAIGLGSCLLDELLLRNNLIKERYISTGFIGFISGYTIYPSFITGSLGITGSLALGFFNLYEYASEIFYPVLDSTLGTSRFGIKGSAFGMLLGVTDQVLINLTFYDKHYLSYSLLGNFFVNKLLGNSLLTNSVGIALGLVLANYENNSQYSSHIVENLNIVYTSVIKSEKINQYITQSIITILSLDIAVHGATIKILQYQQGITYQFEHMDVNQLGALHNFNTVTLKFLVFLVPFATLELMSTFVCDYFSTKLYIEIDNELKDILFSEEIALSLSHDQSNKVLIDNLKEDAKIITYDGIKLFNSVISRSIKGLYGSAVLLANSADILVYSVIYNQINQYVSNLLITQNSNLEIAIKIKESQVSTMLKHDMHNINIITSRKGIEYSREKIGCVYNDLRVLEFDKAQLSNVIDMWNNFISMTDFIYNYYLTGYKINVGAVNFNDRIKIHYASWQVSSLLSWKQKNAQGLEKISMSVERIKNYLDKIDEINTTHTADIIERKVNRNDDSLVLCNLKIKIADRTLIYVDFLKFEFGARYLIVGDSGSGKSSLISKIMGIKNNCIGGQGIIYYPENSDFEFISQQDYFPLNSTLKEIIFYPKNIEDNKMSQVIKLVEDMNLGQYDLDKIENWYTTLSGGEKKKIMLISAIIKNPNILILDEVFNGLDLKSISVLQTAIKDNLLQSIIISIEHNVKEAEKYEFYDHVLKIVNETLISGEDNTYKYQGLEEFGCII